MLRSGTEAWNQHSAGVACACIVKRGIASKLGTNPDYHDDEDHSAIPLGGNRSRRHRWSEIQVLALASEGDERRRIHVPASKRGSLDSGLKLGFQCGAMDNRGAWR